MIDSVIFVGRPAYPKLLEVLEGYPPDRLPWRRERLISRSYPAIAFPRTPLADLREAFRGVSGWIGHELDPETPLPRYSLVSLSAGDPEYLDPDGAGQETYVARLQELYRRFERRFPPPLEEEIRRLEQIRALTKPR